MSRRTRIRAWIAERKVGPPSWLAVVVIVVLVAAPAYLRQEQATNDAKNAAHRAEEAIALLKVQRDEARMSTCLNDRTFATGHNGLVLYLTHIPGRPPPDPAVAEAFEKANLVPVRECTPEAIDEFYGEPAP